MKNKFLFFSAIMTIYCALQWEVPARAQQEQVQQESSARFNWSSFATDDKKTLWTATQKIEVGFEPETKFYEVDLSANPFKLVSLPLPTGWHGREVFAIFPSADQILVLSQWNYGGGDLPKFSTYDRKKKTWSASKAGGCIQFTQLVLQKDRIEFRCEDPGTGKAFSKTIAVKVPGISKPRTLSFPQADNITTEYQVRGAESGQIEVQKSGNPQKRVIPLSP